MSEMKTDENKQVKLEFDPARYSEKIKNMILARASQWNCSPQEAVRRILEERASKATQSAA